MYNTAEDLLDALQSTPDTLQELLSPVTNDQAAKARGGDENWSVIEILCHLRDVEERAIERMRQMRDEQDPKIPAFDQEKWAVERNYAKADLKQPLERFLDFRATHIRELSCLRPEDWERIGEHEEQRRITISAHTLHIVSHDAVHLAQIARQLGSTK